MLHFLETIEYSSSLKHKDQERFCIQSLFIEVYRMAKTSINCHEILKKKVLLDVHSMDKKM